MDGKLREVDPNRQTISFLKHNPDCSDFRKGCQIREELMSEEVEYYKMTFLDMHLWIEDSLTERQAIHMLIQNYIK